MTKSPETALNVWLSVMDNLLSKSVSLDKAMYIAGNKLVELQKEYNGDLFDRNDLAFALECVNLFMSRHKPTMGKPPAATVSTN